MIRGSSIVFCALYGLALVSPTIIVYATSSQPDPSIVLPVHVESVHDGDTMTCTIRIRTQVRLIDCWAPELSTKNGIRSRDRMIELSMGKDGVIEIPLVNTDNVSDLMTFGRILGRVWVDGKDVGSILVSDGLASRTKGR